MSIDDAAVNISPFARKWEYVQLVTDSAQQLLSVAIWPTTFDFRPRVKFGPSGGFYIDINATPLTRLSELGFDPDAALGFCGANRQMYDEAYNDLLNAFGARSVALGVSNIQGGVVRPGVCGDTVNNCGQSVDAQLLTAAFAKCMLEPNHDDVRRSQFASVVVLTDAGTPISDDMVLPPDAV